MTTVLNRAGRFQEYAAAYRGDHLANKYGKVVGIYYDNLARATHSMTGRPYLAYGNAIDGPVDCLSNKLDDVKQGYDLTLITYKAVTQCKRRTIGNYWLDAISPENYVELAAADTAHMGIKDGDRVKLVSASNPEGVWIINAQHSKPMIGKAKVLQDMRPSVVAFSLGYGHWANGAGDMVIDNTPVKGDRRRATGIHGNAAMRVDPVLKNTCLEDTVGVSAVFYQTPMKVLKI